MLKLLPLLRLCVCAAALLVQTPPYVRVTPGSEVTLICDITEMGGSCSQVVWLRVGQVSWMNLRETYSSQNKTVCQLQISNAALQDAGRLGAAESGRGPPASCRPAPHAPPPGATGVCCVGAGGPGSGQARLGAGRGGRDSQSQNPLCRRGGGPQRPGGGSCRDLGRGDGGVLHSDGRRAGDPEDRQPDQPRVQCVSDLVAGRSVCRPACCHGDAQLPVVTPTERRQKRIRRSVGGQ
ncbi:uncharacterized protein LOC117469089 isoform X2 [Trematomus bernacchii]|uniref:uncharacterized protein LOC117469089 isoform X2 n=1 Tax=Trematomus bernacchii TaxID=40690 RepID=UPI001469DD62|nr:uncharacterized protein LOC117469089 isoform X2 [Trematomus bernacchii]